MRRSVPKRVLLIGVLIATAAGVSAWNWMRLRTVSEASNPTEYWRRAGSQAYSKMASVSFDDAEAIADSLAQAPIGDPDGRATPRAVEDLRDVALEFLRARMTADTADAYIDWMRSQGYRLKTTAEFEPRYGPLRMNANRAGSDASTVEGVFRALWDHPPSSRAVPNAIAVGPDAMAIEIATSNHNQGFTARLSGTLGEQLWHGGSAATCRFWFQPPATRKGLVERAGEALAAQVGVVAVHKGGDRHPIILQLFWDPATQRWWIDGVNVTNYQGTDTRWTCCEY